MSTALSPAVRAMPAQDAKAALQRKKNREAAERKEQQVWMAKFGNFLGRKGGAVLMGQFSAADIKIMGRLRLAVIPGLIGAGLELLDAKRFGGGMVAGALSVGLDLALYEWSKENRLEVMKGAEIAIKAIVGHK